MTKQECLQSARECERLAGLSKDARDRKRLLETAGAWRELAEKTESYERMVGRGRSAKAA